MDIFAALKMTFKYLNYLLFAVDVVTAAAGVVVADVVVCRFL